MRFSKGISLSVAGAMIFATSGSAATDYDLLNSWLTAPNKVWRQCPLLATMRSRAPNSPNPYFAMNGTLNDGPPGNDGACKQSGPHVEGDKQWWVQVITNMRPAVAPNNPNPCANGGNKCTVDVIRVCSRSHVRPAGSPVVYGGPCKTAGAKGGIGYRGCEVCAAAEVPD